MCNVRTYVRSNTGVSVFFRLWIYILIYIPLKKREIATLSVFIFLCIRPRFTGDEEIRIFKILNNNTVLQIRKFRKNLNQDILGYLYVLAGIS